MKSSTLLAFAQNANLVDGYTGAHNSFVPYGSVTPYGSHNENPGINREELLLQAIASMGDFEPIKIVPDQIAVLQGQLNSMNTKLDLVVTKLDNVYFDDVRVKEVKDAYSNASVKKTNSVVQWLKGLFGVSN